MSRRISLGAALMALALLAAGCAGSTPGSGELVWAIGGPEARPSGVHHDTVEIWNQLHPNGPRVRIETLPDEADDQRQQMRLELDAQSPDFDILGLDVVWTGEFAQNGWLESLEDLRPRIERASLPGPLESAAWGGTLWAAPYNSNAGLLYYRTDLVDQPPRTWDELMEVGVAAGQRARIAPFVGQGAQYEGMVVHFLELYWGAGGELFNPDGTQVLFDDRIALQAIGMMQRALRDGFYAPGFNTMREDDARNAFQAGNAVFMRNWPYAYSLMTGADPTNPSAVAGRFAVAPLPTLTGDGTVSALGGFNLAVSRFSDNVAAAKEFVLFASTNPEVQRNLGRHSVPPTLASAYQDLGNDPVMTQLRRILPDARPRPPSPDWSAISEEIQRQVFAAYNGQRDLAEAVAAIHAFLEATINER